MAPSPSPEPLAGTDIELLLDLAEDTLAHVLLGDRPTGPAAATLPANLRRPAGAFVTLFVDGALNGCIGTVEGDEPLAHAVPRLALSAAFADPRLPPLRPADYPQVTIELSLLSSLQPVAAESWPHLHDQLQPGVDGLTIEAGTQRGLFLPAVWEKIPDPADFLDQLFVKAGLRPRSWTGDTRACRFTAHQHTRHVGHRHAA